MAQKSKNHRRAATTAIALIWASAGSLMQTQFGVATAQHNDDILAAPRCFQDVQPPPEKPIELRLFKRGWTSHDIVHDVAAILLREKMGYPVKWVTNTMSNQSEGEIRVTFQHHGTAID